MVGRAAVACVVYPGPRMRLRRSAPTVGHEVHLTVAVDRGLAELAGELGVRCTHIRLARGRHPDQPMLTWRGEGGADAARGRLRTVTAALRRRGVAVIRSKIELDVRDIDRERPIGPDQYFEQHIKLLLPDGVERETLLACIAPFAAHLSHNARRARGDGQHERFVTQRGRGRPWAAIRPGFEALRRTLVHAGQHILSVEQELVVYDSRAALDAGWLEVA